MMYVDSGAVRLSVVSHAGKEAVIAVLEAGHFSAGLSGEPAAANGDRDDDGALHDHQR